MSAWANAPICESACDTWSARCSAASCTSSDVTGAVSGSTRVSVRGSAVPATAPRFLARALTARRSPSLGRSWLRRRAAPCEARAPIVVTPALGEALARRIGKARQPAEIERGEKAFVIPRQHLEQTRRCDQRSGDACSHLGVGQPSRRAHAELVSDCALHGVCRRGQRPGLDGARRNDRPVDGHPVHFGAPAPHEFVQLRRGFGIPVENSRHETRVRNHPCRLAQAHARTYACGARDPACRNDLARTIGGAADNQRLRRGQAFPASLDIDDEIRQHEGEQRGHVCSLSASDVSAQRKGEARPAEWGAPLRPGRGSDAPRPASSDSGSRRLHAPSGPARRTSRARPASATR